MLTLSVSTDGPMSSVHENAAITVNGSIIIRKFLLFIIVVFIYVRTLSVQPEQDQMTFQTVSLTIPESTLQAHSASKA